MSTKKVQYHNPESVSRHYIGEGFRLLTKPEQAYLRVASSPTEPRAIQGWNCWRKKWSPDCQGNSASMTYRTRKPLGYFLPKKPKPKRKVEGPSMGYMNAYNKFMRTGYKDPQSCIAGTMMSFHFFNAGRRYERRRLKAGGAT